MLGFDRKQQNFVKQLSFIKKLIKRKRICPSGDKKLTPLKNRILERMVILPKISQSKKKKRNLLSMLLLFLALKIVTSS